MARALLALRCDGMRSFTGRRLLSFGLAFGLCLGCVTQAATARWLGSSFARLLDNLLLDRALALILEAGSPDALQVWEDLDNSHPEAKRISSWQLDGKSRKEETA